MRYTSFTKPQNKKILSLMERADKQAGLPSAKPSSLGNAHAQTGASAGDAFVGAKVSGGIGTEINLTQEQKKSAELVGKLHSSFPIDGWEKLSIKEQLQAMKFSGLSDQEQWNLLNSSADLSVLAVYNEQKANAILNASTNNEMHNSGAFGINFEMDQSKRNPGYPSKLPSLQNQNRDTKLRNTNADEELTAKPLGSAQPMPTPVASPTPLPKPGASPIIPTITPTPYPANAEYAYVFYTDNPGAEFSEQAKYQKQILESQGYKVKLICTNSAPAFSNAWNNMDPKSGAAVILSHSNGMSLLFQEGTKTNAIGATGRTINNKASLMKISDLKGPDLALLYILACNAGHQELLKYEGTNVADAFRDLPNVDKVYAYDGSVGFGIPNINPNLAPRLALDQRGYFSVYSNFDIPYEFGLPSGQLLYDDENQGE